MNEKKCEFCGTIHGPRCPSVKAIEYYPDGKIKRIEYITPADFSTSITPFNWPNLQPDFRGR
jgi:hypothetical protein